MAQNGPNPVDVVDIQFKLHTKEKIFKVNEPVFGMVNLLAVSSAHGLLFAGHPEVAELKVFMLQNLGSTANSNSQLLVRVVPLPNVASLIASSCDGSMLAVSYTQHGSLFLQIYSVPSFTAARIHVLHNIRLTPEENLTVSHLLWNPVIAANLAVVLSNGALGMYTLKDAGQIEMHTLDKSQQVQCGCWSPKGKQIVLGFANGRLQQFKPDLTPAKTINCPAGVHPQPFSTIAVHWLSTFQFAAAFLQQGEETVPSLYIINAPKGGTPSYINYYDVCYTTGQRQHQISFTHIQQWNLLLVASANGIEVGVLSCREGGETPTWVQNTLLDEARIEMPLTPTKDETFPIGFAYDTSSSHHLIMNDKELPVMPMVHVLSTDGQLLSFNFLNLIPGAPDVCSPPPPISFSAQDFRPLEECLQMTKVADASHIIEETEPKGTQVAPSLVSSTPLQKEKTHQFFGGLSQPLETGFGQPSMLANLAPKTAVTAKPTFGAGFGGGTASGLPALGGFGVQQKPLELPQSIQAKPQQQPQQTATAVSAVKSSELNKPLYTVPPNFTPPTTAGAVALPQKAQTTPAVASTRKQADFFELIMVRINAFDKEIKRSANKSKGLLNNIGSLDEMKVCTKRLNDLHEINEQADDHEFEMDVQNLRHFLKEVRAMLDECHWKLEKYNNPDLPRLANSSATDPMNRRQLAKLQTYLLNNDARLQLVKQQIDGQWASFQDTVRRNTKSQIHIPCLDGIYQRLTKMQEIISQHRKKLNQHKAKLQQLGLLHKIVQDRETMKSENTMESLADSILSMTLAKVVEENRAGLSNEKLNAIRDFTRQRQKVNVIKAQRPNRVDLKSEVILETMLKSERSKTRESLANKSGSQKVAQADQAAQSMEKAEVFSKPESNAFITKPTKPMPAITTAAFGSSSFSFNNANTFVKTPVTAPTMTVANVMPQQTSQPTAANLNFKSTAPFGGFNIALSAAQNYDLPKINDSPPAEMEPPANTQMPISFAAKVVGGTNALAKGASTLTGAGGMFAGFAPETATVSSQNDKTQNTSEEVTKPFSFGTIASHPATSSASMFGGLGITTSTTPVSKPPVFSGIGNTGSFTFSGFSTAASTATPTSGIVTGSTTAAPTKPAAASIFSGLGKSIGENAATPQNLTVAPVTSSTSISIVPKSPLLTDASTLKAGIASTTTANVSAASTVNQLSTTVPTNTATPDSTDALLGSLNICKPTTKADIPLSTAAPSNIFSGFGGAGVTSFAPTFGDLTKTLASTAVSTTTTTSTTTVTKSPQANEFSFSLAALGEAAATATTNPAAVAVSPVTDTSTATGVALAIPTTATTGAPLFGAKSTSSTLPNSSASSIFSSAAASLSITTTAITTNAPAAPAVSTAISTAMPNIFGAAAGKSPFFSTPATSTVATTGSSSIFGTPAVVSVPTSTPIAATSSFGNFSTAITTTTPATGGSIFAAAAANIAANTSPPSSNIFGGMPKPDQSVFGANSPPQPVAGSNIFTAAAATPNASPFGNATTPNQAVSGGSIFGSPFAATAVPATGSSIFGGAASKPIESGNIFGAAAAQTSAPASGGSIFGQNAFGQPASPAAPTGNIFASPTAAAQPAFNTSGSIFGGGGSPAVAPSAFGSPSANTSVSTGFGSFSQPNTGSPFGSPVSAGPFGQGGASVAQSGFGSPQQQSAFSKPLFGGPATFGSPPAFGAQPSFGGAATFGGQKPFGSFGSAATTSPPTGMFGAPAQKNNLFEALGASDTGLSFGNLAQNTNANVPKPAFGGSSFTNYRS